MGNVAAAHSPALRHESAFPENDFFFDSGEEVCVDQAGWLANLLAG
jgi:hypothetical protein